MSKMEQYRPITLKKHHREFTNDFILWYCCFTFYCVADVESEAEEKTQKKLWSGDLNRWIKRRRQQKQDPLDVLLKLYAKEDNVVEELEEVRLNPDFTSVVRNDLEFYIPQLWSYWLYEDEEEEIMKFIILSAQSNLYFSHRVLFFLESLDSKVRKINDKIQNMLISLTQIAGIGSENDSENSRDKWERQIEIENAIEKYKKIDLLPEATIKKFKNNFYASDIKLGKFDFTMGVRTPLTNENGYLSTPFFIFSLTNLWNIILNARNREEALFNGLQQINLHLPANVYIPFVTNSMRNYVILHIKVMEAKVFVTKTKAPYLIWVEVFRPEEAKFKDKIDKITENSFGTDEDFENFDIELREQSKNIGKLIANQSQFLFNIFKFSWRKLEINSWLSTTT